MRAVPPRKASSISRRSVEVDLLRNIRPRRSPIQGRPQENPENYPPVPPSSEEHPRGCLQSAPPPPSSKYSCRSTFFESMVSGGEPDFFWPTTNSIDRPTTERVERASRNLLSIENCILPTWSSLDNHAPLNSLPILYYGNSMQIPRS